MPPHCLNISQLIAISNEFNLIGVKLHISCIIHSLLAQIHIISEILTSGKINSIVLNKLLNINVQGESAMFYFLSIYIILYINIIYNNTWAEFL